MSSESASYQFLRESIPVLLLCGLGLMAAGSLFGLMVDTLKDNPGLIILIPAIIGMRGNISTALGSRLGSASHLGLINVEELWNEDSKVNLKASLLLSLLMGVLAGVLAYLSQQLLGDGGSEFLPLVAVAMTAGVLSGFLLAGVTMGIMVLSFRKGYDPDNITGPLLSTVGDMITLAVIFLSAWLFFDVL